jgi:hypothetical protein
LNEVEDPEALDSGDEDHSQLNGELGLDDNSGGVGQINFIIYIAQINETCSNLCTLFLLFAFAE